MATTAVIGMVYGDEGKGRIVDYLSQDNIKAVCRYAGGPNAGHTIVVDKNKYVARQVPSGIFQSSPKCYIGQGTVIDLNVLSGEIEEFSPFNIRERLFVSNKAHLIMPYHKLVDKASGGKIGTTGNGIGPAYQDKAARRGLRVEDLFNKDFETKFMEAVDFWKHIVDITSIQESVWLDDISRYSEKIKYMVCDVAYELNKIYDQDENIILEGAQATMLDIDNGTYPFVSSSSNGAAGACAGSGLPPAKLDSVIGVFKAYTTRVGNGPFSTKIEGPLADEIRKKGHEFGTVTKRPRDVGWLNLDEIKYAIMVNGVDELALTKVDILAGLGKIKVFFKGEYIEFDGWDESAPSNINFGLNYFLNQLEEMLEVSITMVSFSPERKDIKTYETL